MRVDDGGGPSSGRRPEPARAATPSKTPPKPATSAPPAAQPATPKPAAPASGGASSSSASSSGAGSTAGRTRAASLDRDSDQTPSNPAAARSVTQRQSSTAARLTGGTADDGPSTFDALAADSEETSDASSVRDDATLTPAEQAEKAEEEKKLDHLVENPVEEEQRSDLATPPAFQPGAEVPNPPDFAGQAPKSSESLPDGGKLDKFVQDGVTYTRSTRADGSVATYYEQNGVNYSNTVSKDGGSTMQMSSDTDTGLHSRTVTTAAGGEVTDASSSSQGVLDRDGNWSYQSRQESLGPDGVRAISEEVTRPDGGRATVQRTVQPDGRINEVYSYRGDQGTVDRTTNQAVDGTAETRTERNYTVDQPLESVLASAPPSGISPPKVPDAVEYQVVDLPTSDRGETSVREVEVVATSATGEQELQYSEESYSQSSGAVELEGSTELGHGSPSDTFAQPIVPNNDDSSITRTVTRVKARDENGELVESTGASQILKLVGDQHPEINGGGQVSVTRTDSWNDKGESSANFTSKGFREADLFGFNGGGDELGGFSAWVDGRSVSGGYPNPGVGPFDAYNRKGGDELKNWLDLGSDDPLDISVTANRDADGNPTSQSLTLNALDATGEGKTATRTDAGGAVGWTYTDYDNGGEDYKRQTVFEGTDVSTFETHQVTGPGQFETTSETREGDSVVASSSASRQEVDEASLRQSVTDGELTQAQLDRMLTDGPPYYAERLTDQAEPLFDDDGKLREDEDGNPIQAGHYITSTTLANSDGYAVAEHFRRDPGKEDRAASVESRLSTVSDPAAANPVTGELHTQIMNPETCKLETLEQGSIEVGADGKLSYDGQEIGQFDFAGSDLRTLMRDGESVTSNDLVTLLGGAAQAGQSSSVLSGVAGGRLRLTGTSGNLSRLAHGANIFGVVAGARDVYSGIAEGDARSIVEGAGGIAGGLNSLAAATSALGGSTKLGSAASRFSTLTAGSATLGKALGAAGGVVSLGFGLYDVFTADSGWDKASGGLAAAAGAVAIGSAFFGPPGWVVGGLVSGALGIASIFVGGADDNDTAALDDRLR